MFRKLEMIPSSGKKTSTLLGPLVKSNDNGCTKSTKVKVKVKLHLTVSQSVCFGVKFTLELVTRYYILSERSSLPPVSLCQ
jgi:hypothetical protein